MGNGYAFPARDITRREAAPPPFFFFQVFPFPPAAIQRSAAQGGPPLFFRFFSFSLKRIEQGAPDPFPPPFSSEMSCNVNRGAPLFPVFPRPWATKTKRSACTRFRSRPFLFFFLFGRRQHDIGSREVFFSEFAPTPCRTSPLVFPPPFPFGTQKAAMPKRASLLLLCFRAERKKQRRIAPYFPSPPYSGHLTENGEIRVPFFFFQTPKNEGERLLPPSIPSFSPASGGSEKCSLFPPFPWTFSFPPTKKKKKKNSPLFFSFTFPPSPKVLLESLPRRFQTPLSPFPFYLRVLFPRQKGGNPHSSSRISKEKHFLTSPPSDQRIPTLFFLVFSPPPPSP